VFAALVTGRTQIQNLIQMSYKINYIHSIIREKIFFDSIISKLIFKCYIPISNSNTGSRHKIYTDPPIAIVGIKTYYNYKKYFSHKHSIISPKLAHTFLYILA